MKYIKGEFTTVPSKSARNGLKPSLQVVYMWLCDYSDSNQESWPSRALLANNCGMSIDTLDRALSALVELGLIEKKERFINNEQTSNLYIVNIVEKAVVNLPPSTRKLPTQNSTQLTQPNNLTITKVIAEPVITYGNPNINKIIDSFTEITGIKLTNIKRQRQFASLLLKRSSLEEVLGGIAFVAMVMDDQYAPRISDIEKLYYKWGDLQVYSRKKNAVNKETDLVDISKL